MLPEQFTIKITKDEQLPLDWNFAVYQGRKRISHGLGELRYFGEVLETEILRPYLNKKTKEESERPYREERIERLPKPVQLSIGDVVKIEGFVGSFALDWHEGRLSLVPISHD